jgi:hypothetical protein
MTATNWADDEAAADRAALEPDHDTPELHDTGTRHWPPGEHEPRECVAGGYHEAMHGWILCRECFPDAPCPDCHPTSMCPECAGERRREEARDR